MKEILSQLMELKTLSQDEAKTLMTNLGQGVYNDAHLASLLTVFMLRPIALSEMLGYREALLELCIPFKTDYDTIDLCGTGGDGKNTFNISTLSSIVVAASGYKVAKHGNYGVSSASGSSNVMEYFGYTFTNNESILKRQLDQFNICFLHAPLFHPALKHVAGVRKQMGTKTFFNMLGPLVNPAKPKYKVTGVFNMELARLYHYILQSENLNYTVLYDLNGFDEVSLTGNVKLYTQTNEAIFQPFEHGFTPLTLQQIYGGESVADAAKIFIDILENKSTRAQQDVVVVNAALAIQCMESNKKFEECVSIARESIVSGKALQTLKSITT